MKVLDDYALSIPLTSKVMLYALSDSGMTIYKKNYGEHPVDSEIKKVRREHDNLEHGYEILNLEKILKNCDRYKEVFSYNRSNEKNPGAKYGYIPDLLCVPADGGYFEFFEYERGTHKVKDFSDKLTKMSKVTSCLNIIVQNKKIMVDRVYPIVKDWVKEKGQILKSSTIRLTTPQEFQNNAAADDCWQIIFKPKESLEPIYLHREIKRLLEY